METSMCQTVLKLGLMFGYLLWLLDELNENVYDLLNKMGWMRVASFIRSRGTKTEGLFIKAGAYADILANEYCEKYDLVKDYRSADGSEPSGEWYGIRRCFYGFQLYKFIFQDYWKRLRKYLP
jgi:hypothetical protein